MSPCRHLSAVLYIRENFSTLPNNRPILHPKIITHNISKASSTPTTHYILPIVLALTSPAFLPMLSPFIYRPERLALSIFNFPLYPVTDLLIASALLSPSLSPVKVDGKHRRCPRSLGLPRREQIRFALRLKARARVLERTETTAAFEMFNLYGNI